MSKRKMFIRMIISYLMKKKSRVIIAILAIATGATILSGLVTIYYDIPRQLGKEFRSYGANLVVIPSGDRVFDASDTLEIKEEIGEDKIVGMAPYRYQTCKINEQPYMLAGTDLEGAKENSPFWFVDGRWVKNGEKNRAMIGKEIAKKLNLKVGDSFIVKGVKYGYMATSSSQDASAQENKEKEYGDQYFSEKLFVDGIVSTGGAEEGFIFLNIDNLSEILEDDFRANIIECSVEAEQDVLNGIAESINDRNPEFMARPVRRVTQSQDQVLSKLQALVYLVTVVILIITMISVTTTMMAMVAERKQEIGLKKALGAQSKTIIREFMGESIGLGIIGGALGVFLGFMFAQNVSLSVFGRAITFQWMLAPITIILSVVIAALASIIPVRKVLEIEPAIVLKGE